MGTAAVISATKQSHRGRRPVDVLPHTVVEIERVVRLAASWRKETRRRLTSSSTRPMSSRPSGYGGRWLSGYYREFRNVKFEHMLVDRRHDSSGGRVDFDVISKREHVRRYPHRRGIELAARWDCLPPHPGSEGRGDLLDPSIGPRRTSTAEGLRANPLSNHLSGRMLLCGIRSSSRPRSARTGKRRSPQPWVGGALPADLPKARRQDGCEAGKRGEDGC